MSGVSCCGFVGGLSAFLSLVLLKINQAKVVFYCHGSFHFLNPCILIVPCSLTVFCLWLDSLS